MRTLSNIRAADRGSIGGKAYNCARLLQAGFPVPDGLVVPTDAAEADIRSLPSNRWLAAQPDSARYAVRSSATGEDSEEHSFAGVLETQLNVPRGELVEAVLACRRSVLSPAATAYRQTRHPEDDGLSIGVLVQRMVPAVVSGVAFTVNPVSGANELVINAASGLGEALVGGQIDPDEFIVRKTDRTIVSSRRGGARAAVTLTEAQVAELSQILLRIESHYGAPQDVEFCHDGAQFWIVQSRPVTTDSRQSAVGSTRHGAPSTRHPDIEWTRANLAEVFPEQLSPQALHGYEKMLNDGQSRFMGRLLAPELGPMFKVFHGRMYMNVSQLRRVGSIAGFPPADMLRSIGHAEAIDSDDEIVRRAPLGVILRCLPDLLRLATIDARPEATIRRHEASTRRIIAGLSSIDPETMTDREIWNVFQGWLRAGPELIQPVFAMSGVQVRETMLRRICDRVGFPFERLLYTHLAAGERSVSTSQATALVALSDAARREARSMDYLLDNDGRFADYRPALAGTLFLAALDRFLDEYGHRGRYESDWAIPRLHEDPAPALFAVREHLRGRPQDLRATLERQEADAAAARRDFEAKLTRWQRWTLLPRVRALLRRLKKQYIWREQVRSDLTRALRSIRGYHLTLADRFAARGWIDRRDDYFLLHLEEVASAIDDATHGASLRAIVERRKATLAAERDLQLPLFMRESELAARLRRPERVDYPPAGELTGLCVSPGTVEAEVIVMRDPGEFASMKRGAILVTRATDPSWTPLFTLASGVIVEVGGMLSHASTIAREYGLPALANVKNATKILESGDRVRLEASAGRVTPMGRARDANVPPHSAGRRESDTSPPSARARSGA